MPSPGLAAGAEEGSEQSRAGEEQDGTLELPVLLGSSGFGGWGSPTRPGGTQNTKGEVIAGRDHDGFGESRRRRGIWDWVCSQGKGRWSRGSLAQGTV